MSLLAVGLSHRTAATADLERAAVSADDLPKVLHDLLGASTVAEAVLLSTCNRTEIYADVATFHGGVADISDQLSRVTGVGLSDLSPCLYVHHEARAVSHLFSVVCGLDSMLVGETQILGQVRSAFRTAQTEGGVGTALGALFQTALRVGKRAHSETEIGATGASIVGVGMTAAAAVWEAGAVRAVAVHPLASDSDVLASDVLASDVLAVDPLALDARAADALVADALAAGNTVDGLDLAPVPAPVLVPAATGGPGLTGRRVLIVGAGAVGALAAAHARLAGAEEIVIANRGENRARRLAATHGARAVPLADLRVELARADLVVSSTGATGLVIEADAVAQARAGAAGSAGSGATADGGLVFLDLALPRDVDPAVRELPGVRLIDLDTLREALAGQPATSAVDAVRDLVAAEVNGYLDRRRAERVTPTVVALRAQAAAVVRDELDRLRSRLPDLSPRDWANVEGTVRRVVDKLLHAPTVRIQELATAPGGDAYAEALRELFDLPRQAPVVVAAPDLGEGL